MSKVITHILVWNDERYLEKLLKSIDVQTHEALTIRMLDNGSTDDTVKYLQEKAPHYIVSRNTKNEGFAGGHNQLMKFTLDHLTGEDQESTYILIANSDMIWDKNIVNNLAKALDDDKDAVASQPKLLRAFGEITDEEGTTDVLQSDILDTTGIRTTKSLRMSDRGAGEKDHGQYDDRIDIFAPTGTMMMIRLSAVHALMEAGEFYDGDFFAYREDCDLALRMRELGMKSIFVPSARAWHYRGMFGAEKQTWLQRINNRRGQRPFFAALSTRNQLLLLIKHLHFDLALKILPAVLISEIPRTFYGLIFESMTRKRLLEIPGLFPKMWKKRKKLLEMRNVTAQEILKYVDR
ncbi:MAG: glycosyltransferase family 2 protein [bacterium]|nr:glycosyltransferase family 2 protein [bacterium]